MREYGFAYFIHWPLSSRLRIESIKLPLLLYSYFKTLTLDQALPVMQTTKKVNTLRSYRMYFWKRKSWTEKFEEVNP